MKGTYLKRFWLVFVFLLAIVSACAKRPHEKQLTTAELDPVAKVRQEIDQLLKNDEFQNAFWGVAIQSLPSGKRIYELNAGKLFIPASNMKILTAAAALRQLGPDFRYETVLRTDGPIENGVLKGNLVAVGNGDPTISSRFSEDSKQTFRNWIEQLKAAGIESIEGDVIGIDSAFEDERIGYGWSWDQILYYYAPEVSALQFAENAITVTLFANEQNHTVRIQKEPDTSYITVIPRIEIVSGAEKSVKWVYEPSTKTIVASGVLPPGGSDYGSFSVHNPAAYFATVLKEALIQNGIMVTGTAYRGGDKNYHPSESGSILLVHSSPPLREILGVLLKVSQNLYAETVLKTIGNGKTSDGLLAMKHMMTGFGVSASSMILNDGSGLSRYNYITPDALVKLLVAMRSDANFDVFYQAFPEGGVDGTLKSRWKGTVAERNVRAKTGSLPNARALSGYVKNRNGEILVFALMVNHYSAANESAQSIQDRIVELLASM